MKKMLILEDSNPNNERKEPIKRHVYEESGQSIPRAYSDLYSKPGK